MTKWLLVQTGVSNPHPQNLSRSVVSTLRIEFGETGTQTEYCSPSYSNL